MKHSNLKCLSGLLTAALVAAAGVSHAADATDKAEKDLKLRLVRSETGGKKAPVSKQALQLGCPFGDHMVLQRGRKIKVYGSAAPSCPVELTFAGQQLKTTSDAAGKWQVTLEPLEVSKKPLRMQIRAGRESLAVNDILVGEVWVVSGQSNMECSGQTKLSEFKSRAKFYGDQVPALRAEIEKIASFDDPEVRAIRIRKSGINYWRKCVGKQALYISLVGMFFARKLHRALDVPIGIVDTSYGCASIETYLPEEELSKGGFKDLLADGKAYREILENGGFGKLDPEKRQQMMQKHCRRWAFCRKLLGKDGKVDPKYYRSIEWHMSVVLPMAAYDSTASRVVDFPHRGMLWYQGGTNAGDMDYSLRMRLLIEGMRRVTQNPDMPFYFVMVTPYRGRAGKSITFWPQQLAAAADTPNTWIVCTVDTPSAQQRDYHPTSKDFVGERLALAALNKTYGKKDIAYGSPVFDKAEKSGSSLVVSFRFAVGLKTKDGKAPTCFEIAGEDRKFVPAAAVIEGDKVRLSAAGVANPKYARFAWTPTNPGVNLVNGAGLPPFPFDSSDPLFYTTGKQRKLNN